MTARLVDHLPHAPRRQMLGDEVYEGIKTLVMNHVLAPQERLNVDGIAREIGTSSTPVREALARLASEGLVTNVALRGYSVAPVLSSEQVAELYEMRLLIEPWAAARAAGAIDADGITRLEAELAYQPESAGEGYEGYRDFSAHDARLHDLLLELAGNQTIRQTFDRAHVHLHLYRVAYGRNMGQAAEDEHRTIVDAIVAGDSRAARTQMRRHLVAARDRFLATAGQGRPDGEEGR